MTRYEFIKNTIAAIHDQPSVSNEIKKGSDVFTKAWETELESHLKVRKKKAMSSFRVIDHSYSFRNYTRPLNNTKSSSPYQQGLAATETLLKSAEVFWPANA